MNSDGWGQMGAGTSDMRLAGPDLQHSNQKAQVSPMRQAVDAEMKRHEESRAMRLKHLQDHARR